MSPDDALRALPPEYRALVTELTEAVAEIAGVEAVVLGGSRARGMARADSDVDLGLYYFEGTPPAIAEVSAVAERFASDGAPVVTDFYEWGPWVNGGAWIHTRAGKIDLLYRNIDHVRRVIDDATGGRIEWHFGQQPPYGFHSVMYLAETRLCVPLSDPRQVMVGLKHAVASYPPALKAAIIREYLWSVEFTLFQAKPYAARGDVYNTVGCLTRALSLLTQVLFALNETYFISDKGALEAIDSFDVRPEGYGHEVSALLASPGSTSVVLEASVQRLATLFAQVSALAGGLYAPKYRV